MTNDLVSTPLVIFALVAIGLTTIVGYLKGKLKGAAFLCLLSVIAACICYIEAWRFPHLTPLIATELAASTGALILGYSLSKEMGAVPLYGLSLVAYTICLFSALQFGWLGLMGGIIIVTVLAAFVGGKLSGQKSARFASWMWIGWCAFCLLGYGSAGLPGLALITLPCVMLFWLGVYYLGQRMLPIKDPSMSRRAALRALGRSLLNLEPADEIEVLRALLFPLFNKPARADRLRAMQALLTFSLGTNYPYYQVENRKLIPRAKGNPFGQFFSGPGIVLTGCDHTVVTTNGIEITGVKEPGLSFTGRFEGPPIVIDLRCQLHAFQVEALTRDGIRIRVLTFAPFRIHAGDEWPEQSKPFPFRKSAVISAILARPVEHTQEPQDGRMVENKKPREWDEKVNIVATQAVRRIISEYTFDELCAPYQPGRDPRTEIVGKLQRQLRHELGSIGIQVLGGGVSNLLPEDKQLLQRRIGNWQAEWSRRITAEMGKADAEYIQMVESARAQAQAEMIRTISEGFERAGPVEDISKVIALRFIEAIEKMIENPAVHTALPPASVEAVEAIKHAVEARSH